MDLSQGYPLESPSVVVRGQMTEAELSELFAANELRHVTHGYYVLSDVTSMGGLTHQLGFHFEPRHDGRLNELEFFRRAYPDTAESYLEFQEHLEKTFGRPTSSEEGSEGFESHVWYHPGGTIRHFVYDRFGPEEHVRLLFAPADTSR